jgi:hypothetical protein
MPFTGISQKNSHEDTTGIVGIRIFDLRRPLCALHLFHEMINAAMRRA